MTMIDILSNNLIHALNTNNNRLLGYLIDDECQWTDENHHTIVGQEAVISSLVQTYKGRNLRIINGKKSDDRSLILVYQSNETSEQEHRTLFIRHNNNKKISLIHALV